MPHLGSLPCALKGDNGFCGGLTPFKFENMWLKSEGFKEKVKGWWYNVKFRGSSSFILVEKLKALKPSLKVWNMFVFGKVVDSKRDALKRLTDLEIIESSRSLLPLKLFLKKEMVEDFRKWAMLEKTT